MQTAHPLLWALGLCIVAAVAEALCAGRGVRARFSELRLPKYSLPIWAWSLVGLGYYVALVIVIQFFFSGAVSAPNSKLGLVAAIAVLIGNAAWNYVFFRTRSMNLTAATTFFYLILVAWLAMLVWRADRGVAVIYSLYLAYIPYLLWWTVAVWRRNRDGV
jgi:tryptophan-rich sensory protein